MTDDPSAEAAATPSAPPTPPGPPPGPPPDLRLRGDPPRVMRLSRKALIILGLVGSTTIGGALIYALPPPSDRVGKELYSTQARPPADAVANGPRDYGDVPQLGAPLPGDLGRPILDAQQRGETVPIPNVGAQPPGNTGPTPEEQARARAAEERAAARSSGLFLSRGAGAAPSPIASALPALPGADLLGIAAQAPPPEQAEDALQNGQSDKRAFMAAEPDRNVQSAEQLVSPGSPNVVQAGSVIAAALITGLRSDLPGQITAQVTQHVYDSPTGRILLIPQGSRLIGEYDSQISFGQSRVLLAWNRLILPDGRSILLERQPGADAAGYAGLQDRTDYHWGQMMRAAAISTLLGVGTEMSVDDDSDLSRALQRGTQDTLNQTGQQIVRRQLNVQPTLTIRPGFPVRVIVTRDLVLSAIPREARR